MKETVTTLAISEIFYSLQGEGQTMGRPSVFIRLGGCNLLCGGRQDMMSKWRCDTIEVWQKSVKTSFEDVYARVLELCPHFEYANSITHLIFTGGEPLLHQPAIEAFMNFVISKAKFVPKTEIETNGTIVPSEGLQKRITYWNVSPKLKNSGEERRKRFNLKALEVLGNLPGSIFKFVLSDENDWNELKTDFLNFVPQNKVWLMPAADTQKKLLLRNKVVAGIAIREGINFCSRLHIEIWDKKTGV